MTERVCRDCRRVGQEDPEDPAPALCPPCYEKRLRQITPLFEAEALKCADGDITPAIVWLADALERIGGEKREFARKHANTLGHQIVLLSRQQQN